MKTIDEREMQKTTAKAERSKGNRCDSKTVRTKASLIFKSNLELALSIILEKENFMNESMLWKRVGV